MSGARNRRAGGEPARKKVRTVPSVPAAPQPAEEELPVRVRVRVRVHVFARVRVRARAQVWACNV